MDSQGTLWEFLPYDFRRPTLVRIKERLWNPNDERIWIPRIFGVGWSVNLFQLKERYPTLFYVLVAVVLLKIARKLHKLFRRCSSGE